MYYEDRIKELNKEIEKLKYVCSVCIELLDFRGPETLVGLRKDGLQNALRQVVYNQNYNKIRKIEREIEKAKDAFISESHIKSVVERKTHDKDLVDDVYRNFRYHIDDVKDVRRLLHQSLFEIKMNQEEIKNCKKSLIEDKESKARLEQERRKREEERKRQKEDDYTPTYTSSSYSYSSIEEEMRPVQRKTTKRNTTKTATAPKKVSVSKVKTKQNEKTDYTSKSEIKKRIEAFVTDREKIAERIIKEYGITGTSSFCFENEDNAEKIIEIYDIAQALEKKKKVAAFRIAMAFNEMIDIAVEEAMSGRTRYEANQGMIRLVHDFGGPDFVERYHKMYEDYYKYVESLPKSKRDDFEEDFEKYLHADLKQGSSLVPPEEFKRRVNVNITEKLAKNMWNIKESRLDILEYNTKYMDAKEVANIYHKICRDNPYSNHSDYEGIKKACIELILKRMPPVGTEEENLHEILEERREAIKNDYFYGLVRGDIKDGYAEELVSQKELVTSKKKEYFRMSKFKQALARMSYEKLKKLAKKKELTEDDKKAIKGMF